MSYRQMITIFITGGEELWFRIMALYAVELYMKGFTGNAIKQLPFKNSLRTVEVSNRVYKEGRLRGITVFDEVGGYIVNVAEPNPDKGAVRVQVYVKKQLYDQDAGKKYWQNVFHRLYNPKTKEWALPLTVEDERPSLRK